MYIKKLTACLLIIATLFVVPVFALAEEAAPVVLAPGEHSEAACNHVPIIVCEGAWHDIYVDAGTPEQAVGWSTGGGGEEILSEFTDLLPEIPQYIRQEEWDKIADIMVEFANAMFGPIRFDGDGNSVNKFDGDLSGMNSEIETRNHKINPEQREFNYRYDWREDPWLLAERMHNMIEAVCEATGHSTVNVASQSGSTVIFMAYLVRYGTQRIAALTIRSTFHKGSTVLGDLVNGRVKLDANALSRTNFFKDFGVPNHEMIMSVLQAAHQAGLLAPLLTTVNRALPRILDRFYENAFVPSVLTIPMLWAYVPPDDYESGKEFCFGDKKDQYAGLIQKLDRYHYRVKLKADELLQETAWKIPVGTYLGYNSTLFFGVENSNRDGDGIIDTALMSMGAICATPGKRLGVMGVYRQKVNCGHDHISPGRTVDASACLFPEHTWFVRNDPHIGATNMVWARWFFDSPKTPSIHTNPQYPQYVQFSSELDTFVPQEIPTLWDKTREFFNPMSRMQDFALGLVRFVVFLSTWWI